MMPSGVNDTARGDKGALKRFWDRINPVQGITSAGGVYTFVTSNTAYPTAYINGEIYSFDPGNDAAGGDQFQINALGAKPIFKRVDYGSGYVAIVAQDILAGFPARLIYGSTLNGGAGAFLLLNPFVSISGDGAGGISINGLITSNYAGSGNTAFYATAGGYRSDYGPGTAVYLPNGDIVCQGITAASNVLGGSGSGIAIHCTTGAVQADHSGTAFYAPNGDLVVNNVTASVQGFKPGGGSWAAISDVRLKADVRNYKTGLNAVLSLRPVTYVFNGRGGTKADGRRFVGLVADEVLPFMPEMVGTTSALLDPDDDAPSEIKMLDTTALIFALVNCCQELAARVASLETRLARE
jgi:hypothetical protein